MSLIKALGNGSDPGQAERLTVILIEAIPGNVLPSEIAMATTAMLLAALTRFTGSYYEARQFAAALMSEIADRESDLDDEIDSYDDFQTANSEEMPI